MKKILAIMALILIVAGPLFAGAAGESFWKYAGEGALAGAALGSGGGFVGMLIGGVIGGISGGIIGGGIQSKKNEETITENEGAISQLGLTNESILSQNESEALNIADIGHDIEAQQVALAKWQDRYDTEIALNQDTAEQNLKTLKENWGLYNAALASQNREGATARLLSKEQKDRVITYAGDDMELNKDIISDVRSVYEDASNFDENGNLTEEGAQKLSLQNSKYGVYDQQMSNLAIDLMQNRRGTQNAIGDLQNQINVKQKTIELNEKAMALNEQTIEKLKAQNASLPRVRKMKTS